MEVRRKEPDASRQKLAPLWTVLVVEGGVGVGKELVLGVLMEDQHLACRLEWEVSPLVLWIVVY